MKKIIIALLVVLAWQTISQAAFEDWQNGIRANAMAGAYTGMAQGLDAVRWNPAGLAELKGWQAQAYAKRLWGIAGLINETAGLGKDLGKWGGMAVSVQQTGCELETDQSFTFSHGFSMSEQLSFGYNLNLYRLWQNRFGSTITGGVDVGLLARIYRKWRIGCFGHNLNHPTMGAITQYELPSSVAIGLAYEPLPGLAGSVEASKEPGYTTCYKVGAEFAVKPEIMNIRSGVSNEGSLTLYSLGMDITITEITVGYAYEGGHQALAGNHQMGLGYKW